MCIVFRFISCHEILSILEGKDLSADIYIEPNDGDITDEDSADEDDGGLLDNLSGNQLNAPAEAVFPDGQGLLEASPNFDNDNDSTENEEYSPPSWQKNVILSTNDVIFPEANYGRYRDFSPVELFELFFDNEIISLIVDQTRKYAQSKGETKFFITPEEVKVFLGVLVVSGICPIPSRRMYWRNSTVTRNYAVYHAIRRNRFEKIMQFLHFADNSQLDKSDKFAKVRPLARSLMKKFGQHFEPQKHLSHDEAMIEYFGRHGCKQFIRGKPIRFGYKVWCLNTDDGYLATFDFYQGRTFEGNPQNEEIYGKCSATVLRNIESLPCDKRSLPYNIYFDNLFTSFRLLQKLKAMGYGATGTLRENRCKKCPLPPPSAMKKLQRGAMESVTDTSNGINVCRWMDNSVVTIASTCHTTQASVKVKRYFRKEKKKIEIDCPSLIVEYNKHMGGTDRQDQNLNKYRIPLRAKKWYWCVFTWLVDISIQNAWLLQKKCGGGLSQVQFKEYIAQVYLTRYGTPPKSSGAGSSSSSTAGCSRVGDDIRYDGLQHFLVEVPNKKRRRCAFEECSRRPLTQCNKCDVGLCVTCNLNFHCRC